MKNLKENKGVTLIALVITIIVLLILAGVALSMIMGDSGIFGKANTSSKKTKESQALEDVRLLVLETQTEVTSNENRKATLVDLMDKINKSHNTYLVKTDSSATAKFSEDEECVKTITTETEKIYVTNIDYGEEVEVDSDLKTKLTGAQVEVTPTDPKEEEDNPIAGKTASTSNRTLSGSTDESEMTYKNPVIPQGFNAVDTTEAVWTYTDDTKTEVTGWNNGLVISDGTNEFVWVPVDGTNVKYEKWCTRGNYTSSQVSNATDTNTTATSGVTYKAIPVTESTQITKYGGFYVARFEAGLAGATNDPDASTHANNTYSVPVSKKGTRVWNYVDYNHAFVDAEMMINDTTKYGNTKSGIITGTQWDTIMKWYKNSGIGIGTKDGTAQNWGTYKDITYTIQPGDYFRYTTAEQEWQTTSSALTHTGNSDSASESNPRHYHAAGLNNDSYKKNIADMAGNVWEWTAEYPTSSSSYRVSRGGIAYNSASDFPAAYRFNASATKTGYNRGFRAVLYIQ